MLTMDAPSHTHAAYTHAAGDRVAGRYTVGRPLGRGGFGEVYFATSEAGKEVAIKRLTRHTDVELRGVAACLNLKHPHLLALHDVATDDDGTPWVVMEYVAGPSLRDTLDRRGGDPLAGDPTRRWLAGAAAGLEHLHDAGIIHRDVKPGNLFDDDGVVKLGDYGVGQTDPFGCRWRPDRWRWIVPLHGPRIGPRPIRRGAGLVRPGRDLVRDDDRSAAVRR